MKFRDLLATPFFILAILCLIIASSIGDIGTAKNIMAFVNKLSKHIKLPQ